MGLKSLKPHRKHGIQIKFKYENKSNLIFYILKFTKNCAGMFKILFNWAFHSHVYAYNIIYNEMY